MLTLLHMDKERKVIQKVVIYYTILFRNVQLKHALWLYIVTLYNIDVYVYVSTRLKVVKIDS